MTIANADWLLTGDSLSSIMLDYGTRYPRAGYEKSFYNWLQRDIPQPYNSFGNGSAMRVSPVGWVSDTLEEILKKLKRAQKLPITTQKGLKEHRLRQHVFIYCTENPSKRL